MKVRISSRSAESCLLLPSPISLSKKKSEETLVPLPLQHRTVRRRWFQRRRLRAKAMIRPVISTETTTEDEITETKDEGTSTDLRNWELAPETSTDDPEPTEKPEALRQVENKKKRTADELEDAVETKTKTVSEISVKTHRAAGISALKPILLAAAGKKRRSHRDVASLVSPMRSSKRQRFTFST